MANRKNNNSKPIPDFANEIRLGAETGKLVCGADEVGRGPLAGPVVAAAVILPIDLVKSGTYANLTDSKLMPAKARAKADKLIRETAMFSIQEASVAEIDHINILWASMLAMKRAIESLPQQAEFALIDGNRCPELTIPKEPLIKGDQRSLSIAAASTLAKQHRDRIMRELDALHPQYGWSSNMGYPTKRHRDTIADIGATPHHRMSFAPFKTKT